MNTLDFELEISPGVAGSYPVLARGPGGEAATTLSWSLTPAELDHQLAVIKKQVLLSSAVVRRAPTEDEQPVRQLGQQLFEALIADDVRSLYVASRQHARGNQSMLRLVLRVRPPELARLPWEFLFDPGQQNYLSLQMPVVRYLPMLARREPLRVAAPLRILGMVARPGDQHALDTRQEQQSLQKALTDLQGAGQVELEWVNGQTYRNLQHILDKGPWHVFHFIGHGGYKQAADEGTLALSDETGRTHWVGADDISLMLAKHHPLRLVVLNACDTGQGSASDAFSSTAAALIRQEIPAVVAMQFEITDWAAIQFAQSFYQRVAKRQPVDHSVMHARNELRLTKQDTLEWGTPVLYLRAPDGRIFDTTIPPLPQTGPSPDSVPTPELAAPPPTPDYQELPDPPAPPPAPSRVFHFSSAVLTLQHRKEEVNAVAFSPDGCRLATASDDGAARVWDATSGVELLSVTHKVGLKRKPVYGVAFSPDGRRLATSGGDGKARVWNFTSGWRLRINHGHYYHSGSETRYEVIGVVFSPDGRRLATASSGRVRETWNDARRGQGARVWDASSGQLLACVWHDSDKAWRRPYDVLGVAFSPDGCRLATASDDGTARIWDATSGQELVMVKHNKSVCGVAFSPDGRRLATASHDGTARIWALSGDE